MGFMEACNINQPLDSWNSSAVTDMYLMFEDASGFNQSLESWDICSIKWYHDDYLWGNWGYGYNGLMIPPRDDDCGDDAVIFSSNAVRFGTVWLMSAQITIL